MPEESWPFLFQVSFVFSAEHLRSHVYVTLLNKTPNWHKLCDTMLVSGIEIKDTYF